RRDVPALSRARRTAQARGGRALGRRAADARHRTRDAGASEADPDGRAVDGSGAEDRQRGVRGDRRGARRRHHRAARGAERQARTAGRDRGTHPAERRDRALRGVRDAARRRRHHPGVPGHRPVEGMTPPVRRIARRVPTWGAVAPLLGFRRPVWNRVERRLAQALSVKDLARIARRTTPRSVFDYVHGAAEDELSLARARRAFAQVEFEPRVLHDVAEVDTSTTILGRPAAFPLIMAPTGFTRMMQHEGEIAVARAAARAGVPYTLSTMGTTAPA